MNVPTGSMATTPVTGFLLVAAQTVSNSSVNMVSVYRKNSVTRKPNKKGVTHKQGSAFFHLQTERKLLSVFGKI
jgi:hypothetical protein